MNRKLTVKELNSYAIAGAIAEEVLTAIKTVTAFGAQERETERLIRSFLNAMSYGSELKFIVTLL